MNGGWGISYEIALRWMPQDLTDDKSTLVQVMAWCRQATSSQCWPRTLSPYGIIRPQWVKLDFHARLRHIVSRTGNVIHFDRILFIRTLVWYVYKVHVFKSSDIPATYLFIFYSVLICTDLLETLEIIFHSRNQHCRSYYCSDVITTISTKPA